MNGTNEAYTRGVSNVVSPTRVSSFNARVAPIECELNSHSAQHDPRRPRQIGHGLMQPPGGSERPEKMIDGIAEFCSHFANNHCRKAQS